MKERRLRTTVIEDHAVWRLKDGREAFVKILASDSQSRIASARSGNDREQACLEVLKGLAVPELVDFDPGNIPHFRGLTHVLCMAQTHVGTQSVHALKLAPHEYVGVWVFLAEQFVAFRRHEILYCF